MRGELHLGFWSFVKKGTGALDSFFILRSLTLYQFGLYQLLLSFYAILSDFFHDVFGEVVANDIARFIGEGREDSAKRLFAEYAVFRLVMAAIPCALIFGGAPYVSSRYGYGSDMVAWVRILSLLFITDAAVALTTLLLNLRLQFAALAPRATVQKLIQFLVLGFFYFFSHLGIREIFLSQLAGAAGVVVLLAPVAARSLAPWRGVRASPSFMLWGIIGSYGKWVIPSSVLGDFTGKVRPWLIRLFLNTEAVGIFSIANTFISAIKDVIPTRTAGMLIPRKTGDPEALARFYRLGTKYYVWFAVVLSAAAAGGVPLVVRLLFPKFTPSLPLFYMMLAVVPMFAFVKPMSFFLVAFRRQKFMFWQSVAQNALWIGAFLALVPVAGLWGLGIVEVMTAGANIVFRYRYLKREHIAGPFDFGSLLRIEEEDKRHLSGLARHIRSFFARA